MAIIAINREISSRLVSTRRGIELADGQGVLVQRQDDQWQPVTHLQQEMDRFQVESFGVWRDRGWVGLLPGDGKIQPGEVMPLEVSRCEHYERGLPFWKFERLYTTGAEILKGPTGFVLRHCLIGTPAASPGFQATGLTQFADVVHQQDSGWQVLPSR